MLRCSVLLFASVVHGAVHEVDWIIPTEPNAITITVGDTVRFSWPTSEEHNVYQSASQADYDSCAKTGGEELAPTTVFEYTTPAYDTVGTYYYVCTVREHCANGQYIAVTVEAAPPPPAAPCFRSAATVMRANGMAARIDELQPGDAIVAASREGRVGTGTLSTLSIAQPTAKATFIQLVTDANTTLTVTAEHHLPVGDACCATLQKVRDVAIGQRVWSVVADAVVPTTVVRKGVVIDTGLHSPVLTNGAFPIVDGVVTSFDRIESVTAAAYLLPYAEPLLRLAGAAGVGSLRPSAWLAHEGAEKTLKTPKSPSPMATTFVDVAK